MTFPNRCARAWEAMPWVLQGNATPQDNEWLTQHLAQCEACRVEFEQQSRLRLALSLPAEVAPDPNAGLERLMARLDQPEPVSQPVRASAWLSRALVAAVLVQAIGIGILGARLWSENPAPVYRTLSQASVPVVQGSIHVVPDAGMKLADWDALLRGMSLKIIDGPNDVGAYTVVATRGSAQDTLDRLRATQGIRLAELADAGP